MKLEDLFEQILIESFIPNQILPDEMFEVPFDPNLFTNIHIQKMEMDMRVLKNSGREKLITFKNKTNNGWAVWYSRHYKIGMIGRVYNMLVDQVKREKMRNGDTWEPYIPTLKKLRENFESQFYKAIKKVPEKYIATPSRKNVGDIPTKFGYVELYSTNSAINTHLDDFLFGQLEHYYNYAHPLITSYEMGRKRVNEVLKDLEELEAKVKELRAKEAIANADQKAWLKIDDKWAWYALDQDECREEGDMMGHCGSTSHRDQIILSLREITNKGLVPHLSFEYDEDTGVLGPQMKGRANEKPADKYHKYIFPLIVDKRVKDIATGGYAPETNFSIYDLPESDLNSLLKKKPDLKDPFGKILAGYPFEKCQEELDEIINNDSDLLLEYHDGDYVYILESDIDIDDLIRYYGDDTAKYALKISNGDEYPDIYYDMSHDDIKSAFSSLTDELQLFVERQDEEWNEEYLDVIDYMRDNPKEIAEISELYDGLSGIYHSAEEIIFTDEIYENLESAIEETKSGSTFLLYDNRHSILETNYDIAQYQKDVLQYIYSEIESGRIDAGDQIYGSDMFSSDDIKIEVTYPNYVIPDDDTLKERLNEKISEIE